MNDIGSEHLDIKPEADPEQLKLEMEEKRLRQAYSQTFTSGEGRVVLKDLLVSHGFVATNFDPDPIILSKNEGERTVLLHILDMMLEAKGASADEIAERFIDAIDKAKQTGV